MRDQKKNYALITGLLILISFFFGFISNDIILPNTQESHFSNVDNEPVTPMLTPISDEDIIRFWERVIVLQVHNFTHTERISLPIVNISQEITLEMYSMVINSSKIASLTLTEYFPINTTLILLFENNILINYLEVTQ